jgi:DNA-binding transcriptional LysR family regulator
VDVHGTQGKPEAPVAQSAGPARYPELQLHLGEGDRLVDLVREGVDCVLRVGEPQDSAMVGRRIAMLEEATCASPDYLRRHGTPRTPDDLAGHRMIGFVSSATGSFLPLEFTVDGALRHVTLPAAVSVAGAETTVALARLGLGLIQVPRYHVEADFAAGSLVEVLADHAPSLTPVYVLYPQSRQLSPRVRVFIDWLAAEFASRNDGATAGEALGGN